MQDSARQSANEMGKYFGPLRNSDIDTFASDAFAHETHNLPRAYIGRNKFLMATIDFLITKDDDWYTRHILPWLYTEELHVKWNIWRFNRTMMDYEPEQGVPRYVSYESESRSDSLVRRGLAFIIEHGFYKTEIGRQHYLMNLKQIVEAVHETVYYGVMHELLAAPNYYLQWQKKHGNPHSIVSNDAVSMLAEERWRFACVQKDVKGLFVLDAEIKDRMRRVGIEPDAWIFPSKMAIYASMVPEYFNEYKRGGAPATSALEVGAKRFDTFRGNRVFETRSFDTDFMSNGSIEPLVRHREIGEYYVLGEDAHDFKHGIRIFDMSRDKFHTIPYKTAFTNAIHDEMNDDTDETTVNLLCEYYLKDGCTTVKQALDKAFGVNGKNAPAYVAMANGVPGANDGFPLACVKFCTTQRAMKGVPFVAPDFTCSIEQGAGLAAGNRNILWMNLTGGNPAYPGRRYLLLPHKVLMMRPRQTYRMATAILVKGGEELGQTLHGHHDFQLTDDVIHKTHIGHYTFYSKSVVREPKNMHLAEDVYCTGYDGGENTEFISFEGLPNAMNNTMAPDSASIVATLVPWDEDLKPCISMTGELSEHGLTTVTDMPSYATSNILKNRIGDIVNGAPETGFTADDREEVGANAVLFRGAEHGWNEHSGGYEQRQHNTGHWGANVYDGCAAVRLGMYAHLKQM